MKKKTTLQRKKLVLSRATVRRLDPSSLKQVAGFGGGTDVTDNNLSCPSCRIAP